MQGIFPLLNTKGYSMNKLFIFLLISFFTAGIMAHGGKKHGAGKKEMFQKMDQNKDGKISKEEWNAFHESRFTELDKNKDGSVTEEELAEFHKDKHKGKHKGKDKENTAIKTKTRERTKIKIRKKTKTTMTDFHCQSAV